MELLVEEVGESSSPPRPFGGLSLHDVGNEIYNKLLEDGNEDAVSNPDFRRQLDAHFNRLPSSYLLDVSVEKAEDVVLHQKILAKARDPNKRPVFHSRFLQRIQTRAFCNDEEQRRRVQTASKVRGMTEQEENVLLDISGSGNCEIDFEPCSKLEDLNLDVKRNPVDSEDSKLLAEASSTRQNLSQIHLHEIIFSTIDRPKLLSQLSALLSDIGLNIREAHVFSTVDGYSLDVFVVDGWHDEGTDGLDKVLAEAITRSERSLSGTSHPAPSKEFIIQPTDIDWEIDRRLLKIEEKVASGYCGDLYRGLHLGEAVAVKVLKPEHLNQTSEIEFNQEVRILREVQHQNVVRFIGACTKPPNFCIVTEYMPGGNLYDFLHKYNNMLELPMILKFAIDICKGMDYLHQNSIIHRDLKSANLLLGVNNVIKVADFGVARFQNQGGIMTAETGTYRWMAPEVINHQPYDQKADVFSFAIVLWELTTSKIPYDKMTPIQAALGVRKGVRPELPHSAHPRLLDLMQRCWRGDPSKRPSFSEISVELEELLIQVKTNEEISQEVNGSPERTTK